MKGNRFAIASILLLALTTTATAQTQVDLRRQSKSIDFSAAASTKPVQMGTVLPSVCDQGELFYKSDGAPGTNLYACAATNLWSPMTAVPAGVNGAQVASSGNVLTMPAGVCASANLTPYAAPATITVSGSDTGALYTGYDSSCNRLCYAGAGLTVSNYQTSGFSGNSCIAGAPPSTGFTQTGSAQVIAGALQTPSDTTPTVYVQSYAWNGPGPTAPSGYYQCLMDLCASRDGNGASGTFQGSVREYALVPKVDWFASRLTVSISNGDMSGCSGQGCVLSLGIADSDAPHTLLAQGNATITSGDTAATVTFSSPLALSAYHQYFVRMNTNSQAALVVSGGTEVPTLLNANQTRIGLCSTTVASPGTSQTLPATCGAFTRSGAGATIPLLVIE